MPFSPQIICLDADRAGIARELDGDLAGDTSLDNVACVIYTSGSTGKPKGVMIEHRGVISLLHWARSLFLPEQLEGVLAATSICFDLSLFEIFLPLSTGGKVILAGNLLDLPALPAASAVTLINTVPSVVDTLLHAGDLPATVRVVNLAGEALRHTLVERIFRQPSVRDVYNLYGPTETTVYSTSATVPREDPKSPTIGRPVANTRVYVLDRHLQPVPLGVSGELFIGGVGLARGYLNRPDLTAERFTPNPSETAGIAFIRDWRLGEVPARRQTRISGKG